MNPNIPQLKTKRLILRGLSVEDVPSYERYFVDYEVIGPLSAQVPWPYPEGGVEAYVRMKLADSDVDNWIWGLFQKTNPSEMIGGIELWRAGRPEHRGFWLGRKFWGQGLMTEAVAAVTDCAFNELGFEKMILSNALGNIRSRRVKEKSGARYIGLKNSNFVDPKFTQSELFELTKEQWRKFRSQS